MLACEKTFRKRPSSLQAVENAHRLLEPSSLPRIVIGGGGDGDFDNYCFNLFGCVQHRYKSKACLWSPAASCSCVCGASESATLGRSEKSTSSFTSETCTKPCLPTIWTSNCSIPLRGHSSATRPVDLCFDSIHGRREQRTIIPIR